MKGLKAIITSLALGLASYYSVAQESVQTNKILHLRQAHLMDKEVYDTIASRSKVTKESNPKLHEIMRKKRINILHEINRNVKKSQESIYDTLEELIKTNKNLHISIEGFNETNEPFLKDPNYLNGRYCAYLLSTEQIFDELKKDIPILNSYLAVRAISDLANFYKKVSVDTFDSPLDFLNKMYESVDSSKFNLSLEQYKKKAELYFNKKGLPVNAEALEVIAGAFVVDASIEEWKNDIIKGLIEKKDDLKDVEDAKLKLRKMMYLVHENTSKIYQQYKLLPGAALYLAMKEKVSLHHLDKKARLGACIGYLRNGGTCWDSEFNKLIEHREDYYLEQLANKPFSVIVLGGAHNLSDNASRYMEKNPGINIEVERKGKCYGLMDMLLSE